MLFLLSFGVLFGFPITLGLLTNYFGAKDDFIYIQGIKLSLPNKNKSTRKKLLSNFNNLEEKLILVSHENFLESYDERFYDHRDLLYGSSRISFKAKSLMENTVEGQAILDFLNVRNYSDFLDKRETLYRTIKQNKKDLERHRGWDRNWFEDSGYYTDLKKVEKFEIEFNFIQKVYQAVHEKISTNCVSISVEHGKLYELGNRIKSDLFNDEKSLVKSSNYRSGLVVSNEDNVAERLSFLNDKLNNLVKEKNEYLNNLSNRNNADEEVIGLFDNKIASFESAIKEIESDFFEKIVDDVNDSLQLKNSDDENKDNELTLKAMKNVLNAGDVEDYL